ncbi:minor capsid protein [Psychrobacillus sp. L3]|uniref:minor capsid protein n=1 Tax=Psychrobacillus sp. L3 TaxID=3236891 RepID=UPI0036F3C428
MLKVVADYIASNIKEQALIFSENLFINFYPEQPNLIVSVIDLGGYPPDLYAPTREKVIEIKFRAPTHDEGSKLGNEILTLFHSKENYNLDGLRVMHSYARTDVNYLYADSNENEEFSMELVFLIVQK